jgi:hypothetical protein
MYIHLSYDEALAQNMQVSLVREMLHTTLCREHRASDVHLILTPVLCVLVCQRSNPRLLEFQITMILTLTYFSLLLQHYKVLIQFHRLFLQLVSR